MRDQRDYIVAHLTKDGKEYWINVGASRDDGYTVREVIVEPFKYTLLPPSGNDYRLLGHMPGFTAETPTKKNYDEYSFPTEDGSVAVRGALYIVGYQEPAKKPEREITAHEILENYRQALNALHAETLRDLGSNMNNITARFDDQGKIVWIFVDAGRVVAVEEKPFQSTLKPPTADDMKDKLDKEGHIALYVNFDFAKATLKPDAQTTIDQIVELLKRNPDLKVSIDGHTDSVGGHDYNVKLSQDRAASVVAAITAAGIDAGRLTSAGYGPDKPIAPNDTDAGRAKNRRVELVKAS
jgi:outer membrane protein OmpA-like peptidoglycan-associated protein